MVQTILDVLVQENPKTTSNYARGGSNSSNSSWIPANSWRLWHEFNYETLFNIFGEVLSLNWKHPPTIDPGSKQDRDIRSERKLDLVLFKLQLPLVNGALAQASKALEWPEVFYIEEGNACYGEGEPDWGLVSHARMYDHNKFFNLLPGDTKLDGKWQPRMEQSRDGKVRYQWSLPVSQITTYSVDAGCRYGWIITEENLVVIRLSKEPVGPGLAASRPERSQSQSLHHRVASGDTDVSSAMDEMSLDSFGEHSYVDNNPGNVEYQPPEFAVVPRTAKEKGRLTIKLALFCLCLMATTGESHISYSYPPLDSWRRVNQHHFIHTTSGVTSKNLPRGAYEIPPSPEAHEDQPQEPQDDFTEDQPQDDYTGGQPQEDYPASRITMDATTGTEVTVRELTERGHKCYLIDNDKSFIFVEQDRWEECNIRDSTGEYVGYMYRAKKGTYFTSTLSIKGKGKRKK